jgi:WD40 repeat protein
MFLTKLQTTTAALLLVGLLAWGVFHAGVLTADPSTMPHPAAATAQEKAVTYVDLQPKTNQKPKDGVKVVKAGKWVNSLAYCNDGKTMAVVLWNGAPRADTQAGSVVLWDLQKGKVEQTLEEFEKFDKDTLQFWHVTSSRDGTTIAASATAGKVEFGAIKVWEARTGKLLGTFELGAQVQRAVALSADGKKVAGGEAIGGNCEVCIWDVASGNLLKRLPTANMDNWSLALSEDGQWIAAGGWAGQDGLNRQNKVIVWELATGKVKYEWTDPNMVGAVSALAFSPDGKLVAAGGPNDGSIRVWDMQTGKLKHLLSGHEISWLTFSPDGKTLASAGMDGKVILWDVAQEKARVTLPGHDKDEKGRGPWVTDAVFAPDGQTLASGGGDGMLRFWPIGQAKK